MKRWKQARLPWLVMPHLLLSVLLGSLGAGRVFAQSQLDSPFAGLEHLFTPPRQYRTHFTKQSPKIDGKLDDAAWQMAPWSESFVDIEGNTKPLPALATRVKMIWNDSCLFIAAEMQEPHLWATLKQHDEIIYHDNDFEVFIDPDNNTQQYYELEINALNTVLDLFMAKPYRNNSQAMIHWNLAHLRSAVQVQGTLNDARDTDKAWTVELAIPFQSVSLGNQTKVPQEGDMWRINFSRVQWDTEIKDGKYIKKKDANGRALPEYNWVWSPQGVVNMHFPERWGYLQFSRQKANQQAQAFELPYAEKQKRYLWLMYYRQKNYQETHRCYARSLAELGLAKSQILIDEFPNQLRLEANQYQFIALIESPNHTTWRIDQDGLVQALSSKP